MKRKQEFEERQKLLLEEFLKREQKRARKKELNLKAAVTIDSDERKVSLIFYLCLVFHSLLDIYWRN